jgi:hypothetical protein
MLYGTSHKNRINPIFAVRHLMLDPTNSLSVGCKYHLQISVKFSFHFSVSYDEQIKGKVIKMAWY